MRNDEPFSPEYVRENADSIHEFTGFIREDDNPFEAIERNIAEQSTVYGTAKPRRKVTEVILIHAKGTN